MTATTGGRTARPSPGPLRRVFLAWQALGREQRLSALAAMSLWVTMFFPWFSQSGIAVVKNARSASISLTAFEAFSFVELAVLCVSIAVLALLFARGERRAFHLPGGDGTVILVAGVWAAVLIFYRMLDKQGTSGGRTAVFSTGIQWGIFLALFAAAWLAWTGLAIRRAHRGEPPLAEDPTVHVAEHSGGARERERARRIAGAGERRASVSRNQDVTRVDHRGVTRADAEQLSFELPRERVDD